MLHIDFLQAGDLYDGCSNMNASSFIIFRHIYAKTKLYKFL